MIDKRNKQKYFDYKCFFYSLFRDFKLKLRPLRHKKLKIFVFCLVLFLIYHFFLKSSNAKFTSVITCKNDLAQIAIPNEKERQEYLQLVGSDYAAIEEDFFYLVTTQTTNCKGQDHMGPVDDGGWEVCLEPRYDILEPCLVYSFGVDKDFKFEFDAERILKCEIHAFDPSLGLKSFKPSDNIHFHDYGLDNVETYDLKTGWKLKKLANIMEELGHKHRTIDYLKMDVEFTEWLVLNDLVTSGLINNIRQLSLEIHTPEMDMLAGGPERCWSTSRDTLAFMFRTLVDLRNAGMSLYHTRTNHRISFKSAISNKLRYCCHHLHFVNNKHPQNKY